MPSTDDQMKWTVTLVKITDLKITGKIWDNVRTQFDTIYNIDQVVLRHFNAEKLHIKLCCESLNIILKLFNNTVVITRSDILAENNVVHEYFMDMFSINIFVTSQHY